MRGSRLSCSPDGRAIYSRRPSEVLLQRRVFGHLPDVLPVLIWKNDVSRHDGMEARELQTLSDGKVVNAELLLHALTVHPSLLTGCLLVSSVFPHQTHTYRRGAGLTTSTQRHLRAGLEHGASGH